MLGQLGYKRSSEVNSPSHTYIAMCNKSNFDGYYFRKFTLPSGEDNNCSHAAWYFLNVLDSIACLEGCFPAENFIDIKEIKVQTLFISNGTKNKIGNIECQCSLCKE